MFSSVVMFSSVTPLPEGAVLSFSFECSAPPGQRKKKKAGRRISCAWRYLGNYLSSEYIPKVYLVFKIVFSNYTIPEDR